MVKTAIDKILAGEEDSILIPCTSVRNRNVLRTTAARYKSSIKKDLLNPFNAVIDNIKISTKEVEETLYLTITWKNSAQLFRELPDGSLELIPLKKESDPRRRIAEIVSSSPKEINPYRE